MNTDAIAVVIGIIIGVIISIPASILFDLITRQLRIRNAHLCKKRNQRPTVIIRPESITGLPRGDSSGHFCYPTPRRTHKKGGG